MGGESIQGFAELPAPGQHHRGKPCACRPDGRSAARDGPFAPARSRAAHLQSHALAPDPPTGRPRHLRRRPAKSRTIVLNGEEFRVKKNDVYTCAKGTTDVSRNDGETV